MQPVAEVQVQVRREFLVALDERRQPAEQLAGDLGQFRRVGRLDGLLGGEFGGEVFFGDQDAHRDTPILSGVTSDKVTR